MSVVILFTSMLNTVGDIVVHDGKSVAVWYLFMWLWAFSYVLRSHENEHKEKD